MSICMSFGNRYNIWYISTGGCDVYSKSLSTPLLICQSRLYCEKEVRGVERIKNEIYIISGIYLQVVVMMCIYIYIYILT